MPNLISEAISAVKNWWLILMLGILLVLGGIWVTLTPEKGFLALTVLFMSILLVNGLFQIIFSLSNKEKFAGWGWYLAGGILEFLIGVYLWAHPIVAVGFLVLVIGFWLLFRGISVVASSTDLKALGVKGWGWMLAFGILMILLSFDMIADPVYGALYVVYLTGFAMMFMGIAYIMFSLKLKEIKDLATAVAGKSGTGMSKLKEAVMEHLKEVDSHTKDEIEKMFDEYN